MNETKTVNVYLASPFFSDEQVERVKAVEKALTENEFVGEFFSPRLDNLEQFEYGSKEWSKAIYLNDVNHIDWADVLVAVLDYEGETFVDGIRNGHVDSGTAFEIGYAVATKKPVILFHEKGGIVNLMCSESCQAYITKIEDLRNYDFSKMPKIEYSGPVI